MQKGRTRKRVMRMTVRMTDSDGRLRLGRDGRWIVGIQEECPVRGQK